MQVMVIVGSCGFVYEETKKEEGRKEKDGPLTWKTCVPRSVP